MDELVRLEVELARRYLVDGWQSRKCRHSDSGDDHAYWAIRQGEERTGEGSPIGWATLPQRILAASSHLQGGEIPWDVVQGFREKGMGLIEVLDMLGL